MVFGKTDGSAVDLSDIENSVNNGNGLLGIAIYGVDENDVSGISVSSAGDVNGDGYDDLIIGAPRADYNISANGASYVVFGGENLSNIDLEDIEDGIGGFVINGAADGEDSGQSVSSAGDINGDGLDDLIIGAPNYSDFDLNGISETGTGYVVFGKTDTDTIELSALGDDGFALNGSGVTGFWVSDAGDVNGDGLDDVLIGAWKDLDSSDSDGLDESGVSYLIYGKSDNSDDVDLANLNSDEGIVITGAVDTVYESDGVTVDNFGDRAGFPSNAGDVNGDGYDDLIIGANTADANGFQDSGISYVIFGGENLNNIDLADPESYTGFVINGINEGDRSGYEVSSAGDINGDGLDDLIIGAIEVDDSTGASYLVFGKNDSSSIELADVELGIGGFVINGINEGDNTGIGVGSAGDVNGDGFDDLIVGASYADDNTGASYVVYGGQNTEGVIIGSDQDDDLNGDSGADQIVAGEGNDILIGGGGADVLRGGAGNDVLAISDDTFFSLDGGNGTDTLRFDAAMTLDFTQLSDNKITSIEQIDLRYDGGDSEIGLKLTDVLNLGEGSSDYPDYDLVIFGDEGDEVILDNVSNGQSGSWENSGTDVSGQLAIYNFESGGDVLATVLIDQDINTQTVM